jgi:hypothetical protein
MGKKLSANELQQHNDRSFEEEKERMNSSTEIRELEQKKLRSPESKHTSLNWTLGILNSKDEQDKRTIQKIVDSVIKPYENYGDFIKMAGLEGLPHGNRNAIKDIFLGQIQNAIRNGSGYDQRIIQDSCRSIHRNLGIYCDEHQLSNDYPIIHQAIITDLGNFTKSHQARADNCPQNENPKVHSDLAKSYFCAMNIMKE